MASVQWVENEFEKHRNLDNALHMAKYMRNQFDFYGIKTPERRSIYKDIIREAKKAESVDWQFYESVKEAVIDLKTLGYEVVGIEQTTNSVMIKDFNIDRTKKYALVLGNEVDGISDEILSDLDECLEIPQLGTKHSLNVSVCGGIVMWEFFKGLK